MTDVLATRPLLGYPNAEVELIVEDGTYIVKVTDHSEATDFGVITKDRKVAKDWYFHPFVYGYNYPSVVSEDEE